MHRLRTESVRHRGWRQALEGLLRWGSSAAGGRGGGGTKCSSSDIMAHPVTAVHGVLQNRHRQQMPHGGRRLDANIR